MQRIVVWAIASYERTQFSFDSPFDHFMAGDQTATRPFQTELPMTAVPPSVPPMTELVTKAQLVAKHPHLLSVNRVAWALRCRAVNGLSDAVFDSPCGELLIHEPSFLAWFLGTGGRAKPRAGRRGRRRLSGLTGIEESCTSLLR
jgi:hypothetical protein